MKSIVLLSGGLDSAVSLAWAQRNQFPILCLTFDYGQRAAANERLASKKLAEHFQVDVNIVEVPFLNELTGVSSIPEVPETLPQSMPDRNGFFLNVAAAYAENLDASIIVAGFNSEEARVFPDNSFEYIQSKDKTLKMSTLSKVKVVCPTKNMSKEEIVNLGRKLEVPFEFIWVCCQGGKKMCGTCEGCQHYINALLHNGIEDFWEKKQMVL